MLVGDHLDDLADVINESHVEHSVRFVKDERFDLRQIDVTLVDEVEQASGSCDQDVDAVAKRVDLSALLHATVDHGMAKFEVAPVGLEAFVDLHREFSRGAEDQCSRGATSTCLAWHLVFFIRCCELMQNRQRKRTRLAGAGLGTAKDISPGHCFRNRLSLDGRGGVVAFILDCSSDGLHEPHCLKCHRSCALLSGNQRGGVSGQCVMSEMSERWCVRGDS